MKKCPNCQKEYSDVTLFCNDCGVKLDPVLNEEGKKRQTKKWWVFALLMVAIISAISLFLIFRPKVKKIVLTMDSFKNMTEDEVIDLLGKPDFESATLLRWGNIMGVSNNDGSMIRGELEKLDDLATMAKDTSSGYFVSLYDTTIGGISYDKTDHGFMLYFGYEFTDEYKTLSNEGKSSEYDGDIYKRNDAEYARILYLTSYAKLKYEIAGIYQYTYKNASISVMSHMFMIDFE